MSESLFSLYWFDHLCECFLEINDCLRSRLHKPNKVVYNQGKSRRRVRKVCRLQSLELRRKRPKSRRILEVDGLRWREREGLGCGQIGKARLESRHGDTAGRCDLYRGLIERRVAAIIEAVETETRDHGAGVIDGNGPEAGFAIDGEVGVGMWHDAAETLAVNAGLNDAKLRVREVVVDTNGGESGFYRALAIIELDFF